jgi:hypothetical protein
MTAASLTGDPLTDGVIDHASHIVWAVRERDAAAIASTIAAVQDQVGVRGVHALLLVLAAMVPDDTPPAPLLAWLADPDEYRRLRACGVSAITAGARVRMRAERGGNA